MTHQEVVDAITEYNVRMKRSRQFQYFGIEPQWAPGQKDIGGFIHDEVVRQGHDTRSEWDGGRRIGWMRSAWEYAQEHADRDPTLDDVLALGARIEPEMNSTVGFRTHSIWIAGEEGAPPGRVPEFMQRLMTRIPHIERVQGNPGPDATDYRLVWKHMKADQVFVDLLHEMETVDDWYLAFEAIHPFGDGNGRTGKTLHNWLLGTLDDPVLVDDYFGGGNP